MIGMRVSIDNQFHFQFMPPDELKQFVCANGAECRRASVEVENRIDDGARAAGRIPDDVLHRSRRLMEYAVNVWSHQSPAAIRYW